MRYFLKNITLICGLLSIFILFALVVNPLFEREDKRQKMRTYIYFPILVHSSRNETFPQFSKNLDTAVQKKWTETNNDILDHSYPTRRIRIHVFIDGTLEFTLHDDVEKSTGKKYNFFTDETDTKALTQYIEYLREIRSKPLLTGSLSLLREAPYGFSGDFVLFEYFIIYCKKSSFYHSRQAYFYDESTCINLARQVRSWLVGEQRGVFLFVDDDVPISDFSRIFKVFDAYDIRDFSFSLIEKECAREIEQFFPIKRISSVEEN